MNRCVKVVVSGKIQGVGYRHFVQKHAEKLSVEGSIQNREDGTVVIFACALSDILDDFIDFVYEGSSKSEVKDVAVEPMQEKKDFRGVFRIIGEV